MSMRRQPPLPLSITHIEPVPITWPSDLFSIDSCIDTLPAWIVPPESIVPLITCPATPALTMSVSLVCLS